MISTGQIGVIGSILINPVQGAVLNTQGFEKNMQTLPSLKQIYGTTMTELTTFPRFQA